MLSANAATAKPASTRALVATVPVGLPSMRCRNPRTTYDIGRYGWIARKNAGDVWPGCPVTGPVFVVQGDLSGEPGGALLKISLINAKEGK